MRKVDAVTYVTAHLSTSPCESHTIRSSKYKSLVRDPQATPPFSRLPPRCCCFLSSEWSSSVSLDLPSGRLANLAIPRRDQPLRSHRSRSFCVLIKPDPGRRWFLLYLRLLRPRYRSPPLVLRYPDVRPLAFYASSDIHALLRSGSSLVAFATAPTHPGLPSRSAGCLSSAVCGSALVAMPSQFLVPFSMVALVLVCTLHLR